MTRLIGLHHDQVADLRRQSGARRLDVLGSAVRADLDPAGSDLDFRVDFDEVPPARYADACFTLKEGLERLFGRPVDPVTAASLANPCSRDRLVRELRNLYAR